MNDPSLSKFVDLADREFPEEDREALTHGVVATVAVIDEMSEDDEEDGDMTVGGVPPFSVSEAVNRVNVGGDLSPEQKSENLSLICEFEDIFCRFSWVHQFN